MKKIHLSMRNISVSKRMLYSFILMAVVPILVFGVISYSVFDIAIGNKTSIYSQQLLETLGKTIQYETAKYTSLADDIIVSGTAQDALQNFDEYSYSSIRDFQDSTTAIIRSRRPISPNVKQLFILNTKGDSIYSQGGFSITKDALQHAIHLFNMEEKKNWQSMNINEENFIVYVQPVVSRRESQLLGYILVFIDDNAFEVCLKNINLGEGSKLFLLDSSGNCVVSQKDTYPLGKAVDTALFQRISDTNKNAVLRNYEFKKEKSMIVSTDIMPEDWRLVSSIPNSYLRSEMSVVTSSSILLVLGCLLCAVIVYRAVWGSIMRPIRRLVQLLGEASHNNFNVAIIDDSPDELGFLGRAFSQIVKDMQDMIVQVKKEQHQKREFELKMLQAQINPHFLFNALNSLRFTALMSKATNVSDGLAALSNLLKNTIIDKNEFVTIHEELKNIDNYAVIQRLRYGNTFALHYDVEEDVRSYYTIKFLLQPIVENSIIHGINENGSMNEINIHVKKFEEKLVTTITDNGKGFDVSKLNDSVDSKRLSGIGINNVKQRILLYFGESYQFLVESKEGYGTTVTVETPVLTEPPGTELSQKNKEGTEASD